MFQILRLSLEANDTEVPSKTAVIIMPISLGDYLVAGLGSSFVFGILLLFGRIRNDSRILLIIRTDNNAH
mgnify:CR=1 FL=1